MPAIHLNLPVVAGILIRTFSMFFPVEGPRQWDKASRFVGRDSCYTLKDYVTDIANSKETVSKHRFPSLMIQDRSKGKENVSTSAPHNSITNDPGEQLSCRSRFQSSCLLLEHFLHSDSIPRSQLGCKHERLLGCRVLRTRKQIL
jgi:hypothetical protein